MINAHVATIPTHSDKRRAAQGIFLRAIIVGIVGVWLSIWVTSCELFTPQTGASQFEQTWSFANDLQGWTGGFADFPVSASGMVLDTSIYEFVMGLRPLPAGLGTTKAFFIQSHNRSDDVFMFLKRRITGLQAGKRYTVHFSVRFASGAATGSVGIGGSPSESVYMKGGASAIEPVPVNREGFLELNVDKGNQSQSGKNAVVLGTIGVELSQGGLFAFKTLSSNVPLEVETASDGSVWLFVGTDSAFEGLTQLYYDAISVSLTLKQ